MLNFVIPYVEKIIDFLGSAGYAGIFLISLLDRLTVFLIPAEIVLPAFGVLISKGSFSFMLALIWVTLGNLIGNLVLYYIFRKGGRPILEKYGRYVLISKHDLNHLDNWFLKYGSKIVLIGYLIPTAVRSLVPIPAGLSGMNAGRFALYTLIGSLPLNVLYLYAGVKAGDNLNTILRYFEKMNYVIILSIVVLVVLYIYRHKQKRHLTHN